MSMNEFVDARATAGLSLRSALRHGLVAAGSRSDLLSLDSSRSAPRAGRSLYVSLGVKRGLDILIASAALLLLLPLIPVLVLALAVQDGAPILYRQARMGLGGRTFSCLKFRSMARDAQERLDELLATCPKSRQEWEETQKLKRDPRIHWVGGILRKSSLDEIPQLVNVLRGDMSIVGPRPMMANQIGIYGERYADYCSVRPGITGLWQVSGRNTLTFGERVDLDARYLRNVTFIGDLRILVRTVWVVLVGHGSC